MLIFAAAIMEKKRILVVDDERDLCEILTYNLDAEGYETVAVTSAEEALGHAATADLALLDVMMPGMSGFELAERLRADTPTARMPIIFLTAKDSEEDTLRGFSLGADDYVRKPFSVRELLARVKAVLDRAGHDAEHLLTFGTLQLDFDSKCCLVDGGEVQLTRTEFGLLNLLLSHPGQVFSRQQLLDAVWPPDVIVTDRAVDVNIARLRKKIGRYSAHVVTRQGFGYLFAKKTEA